MAATPSSDPRVWKGRAGCEGTHAHVWRAIATGGDAMLGGQILRQCSGIRASKCARVGPVSPRPRAAGGVRAQWHGTATAMGLLSLGVQHRVCRARGRAGRLRGRRARGARSHCEGTRHAHSMPPCCRPADSLAAISTQAVDKLLACATQDGAGCGVQFVRSAGRSWMRWSRVRCGRDLRCSTSPSGQCEVGHGHGCTV